MASSSSEVQPRSTIGSFFADLISWSPFTVARLMRLKQCHENEQWTQQAVTSLVKKLKGKEGAVEELERALSFPGTPTTCITIPCSMDGRLQILHSKGFPHVTYCRIFRWPDLKSHHELDPLPSCKSPYLKKAKEVCINPYHYKRIHVDALLPIFVPKNNDSVPSHALLPFQERIEPALPPTVTCTTTGFIGYDLNSFSARSSRLQQEDLTLPGTVEPQPGVSRNPIFDINEEPYVDPCLPLQAFKPFRVQAVAYEEQDCWASILYYELNSRVGDKFECKNTTIVVDGYSNPDDKGGRFSLGQWNNVKRSLSVKVARQYIGDGIRLEYVMGKLYLECLSRHPVFVQSQILNHSNNFWISSICKVQPGAVLKIFDNAEFSKLLNQCVHCSYESVFELTKMCFIKVGFVKGWGAMYERAEITSTPTWIEIDLNGPLRWLDRVLLEMVKPNASISSMS